MTSTARGITVETSSGVIRGVAQGGTYVFRGVPYGRVARFQAPLAPEPWTGVREALSNGPACPQPPNPTYTVPQAEECLNLNVWTPGLPAAGGIYRARHGLDSALVLDTTEHDPAMAHSPEAKALSARMANAWLAFAATGDPATADLAEWPRYDAQRRATMVFDVTCRVEYDLRGDERRAWDEIDLHGTGLLSRTPVPSR
jgi:carboxylesterase type B